MGSGSHYPVGPDMVLYSGRPPQLTFVTYLFTGNLVSPKLTVAAANDWSGAVCRLVNLPSSQ